MTLTNLYLNRRDYGAETGTYYGTVTFEDPERKIELKLDAELSRRILLACSQEILESGRELSAKLEVASSLTLLASPEAISDPE